MKSSKHCLSKNVPSGITKLNATFALFADKNDSMNRFPITQTKSTWIGIAKNQTLHLQNVSADIAAPNG
jgi:hypothetical protein